MEILIGLVIVILIFSLVGTLIITRNPNDEKYGSSTKRNTRNLTLIYAALIFVAFIFGIYISMN